MASFHNVYKAKAHIEGTKPEAGRKNIPFHPWSWSLMVLLLKVTVVHVSHSPVTFFFHIYNVKLIVISTQQSGLGFQMIPWTETKILNVKSTDCETNLCPDHYWNWGIDSRKEDHEGSLHLHTCESLSHSSELLYFNMTKSQIKRSLIYFESLSYLALWF